MRMVVRKRSDTHYEEAHMSRIATLTAVLTMIVAPTAFAGPVDLRSPDARDAVARAPVTKVDLRSPDAVTPVQVTASGQDLRSPDAIVGFAPSVSPQSTPADDGFNWGILGVVAAALAACAGLAVMLRRHLHVGRPVGA
jgi:hypothetical protein